MGATTFSAMEIDAIGEIMNISLGSSATAVSNMLGTPTNITTPVVSIQRRDEFQFKDLEPAVGVEISYVKGLSGTNVMMFSRNDVRIIVGMMMGMEIPEEDFEMDEMNQSAIREVMNVMMGSSATALSEFLGYTVDISTPVSYEIPNEEAFKDKYFKDPDTQQVVVRFTLEIANKLSSEFLNIMSVDLVKRLLEPFKESLGGMMDDAEGTSSQEAAPAPAQEAPAAEPAPAAEEPAAPSGDSGKLDQSAIDALLNGGGDSAPAPSGDSGKLDQSAIDALLNGGGDSAPQPEPSPAVSGDSGKLDQAAIDALLNGGGDSAPAAEPATSAEDQAKIDSVLKESKPLDQGETDAILARLQQEQAAAEQAAAAAPTPAPAPQPQMQQPLPQAAPAYPQGMPVQYVAAPAGPDPVTLQILNQMQQSQTEMLKLIKDIEDDKKKAAEAAAAAASKQGAGSGNSLIHSMNPQNFADSGQPGTEADANREMLMKVPLEISVEIGRTKKSVKDILELTQGSLVVLDKMAGEQADLYVNGEIVAHGDIVVVEDNFGIRITEILNKDLYAETLHA